MGNRKIKITGVCTPVGIQSGYQDIVGQILELTGNAFNGFKVILKNGERRDLIHFYFSYES
mgnify:CR=1 FL=1